MDLRTQLNERKEELEALRAELAPIEKERDKLVEKMRPNELKYRELHNAIKERRPRIFELEREVRGLELAVGPEPVEEEDVDLESVADEE